MLSYDYDVCLNDVVVIYADDWSSAEAGRGRVHVYWRQEIRLQEEVSEDGW